MYPGTFSLFATLGVMSRGYLAFKIIPGLLGIPLLIYGASSENTMFLVIGLLLVGVYAAEMAVITPVKLARAERAGRAGSLDQDPSKQTQEAP